MKILRNIDDIDKIRVYQLLNNLHQKDMAQLLGTSTATYCRIVNRKFKAAPDVQKAIDKLVNEIN